MTFIREAYSLFKQTGRLIELENTLYQAYYRISFEGASGLTKYGADFKNFILRDIDILNIRNLIRFVKEGLAPEEIEKLLIIQGQKLNRKKLHALSKKDSLDSLYAALAKTHYGRNIKFEGDIISIELALQKYHMKKAFCSTLRNPLSVGSLLSYMIRKLVEIKNLRSIVKAKHLRIDAGYVEKNLLVM